MKLLLPQKVKWICPLVILRIREFKALICLNRFRPGSKVGDGTLHKINRTKMALLAVWIDKTFSGCLLKHRILIKPIRHFSNIASTRSIFDIQLPFDP